MQNMPSTPAGKRENVLWSLIFTLAIPSFILSKLSDHFGSLPTLFVALAFPVGYGLYDALEVLEQGYPCSASKRKKNIEEKCLRRGRKEIKVVVALITHTYEDRYVETFWRVIHFGVISYRRRK